jgi:hypothetical protein
MSKKHHHFLTTINTKDNLLKFINKGHILVLEVQLDHHSTLNNNMNKQNK